MTQIFAVALLLMSFASVAFADGSGPRPPAAVFADGSGPRPPAAVFADGSGPRPPATALSGSIAV
jgi:hypothetical protein